MNPKARIIIIIICVCGAFGILGAGANECTISKYIFY
jgi:hypothetical protein